MAGARDERVVDREPAEAVMFMNQLPRPSWFAVVSLLVLLLMGASLNLYLAYRVPDHRWFNKARYRHEKSLSLPKLEPSVLDALGDDPWLMYNKNITQCVTNCFSISSDNWPKDLWPQTGVQHFEFGFPFVTRTVTNMIVLQEAPSSSPLIDRGFVWRNQKFGISQSLTPVGPHDYEHFILAGLILNPIIYALPPWLIVMGVRWAFVTRRSRKRARLGLCVGCAYELAGLGVCPECGRDRVSRG